MARTHHHGPGTKAARRDKKVKSLWDSFFAPSLPDPITDGWIGEEPFDLKVDGPRLPKGTTGARATLDGKVRYYCAK